MAKEVRTYVCEICGFARDKDFEDCPACSHNEVYIDIK